MVRATGIEPVTPTMSRANYMSIYNSLRILAASAAFKQHQAVMHVHLPVACQWSECRTDLNEGVPNGRAD